VETAKLAFGQAEISDALGNLFGRPENRERQVKEMRALIAARQGQGNLVLVTHGSTIVALTGVSPDTGEMVLFSQGAAAGRLSVPPG
jgi:microcompartment protein CcmK/EutM